MKNISNKTNQTVLSYKLLFLIIITIALISCSGKGKKNNALSDSVKTKYTAESNPVSKGKYRIKSGIITMNSETMGMVQSMTIYFDDYGNKECSETKGVIDMGIAGKIQIHNMTIVNNGYIYNLDISNKSGTKSKCSFSAKDIDFSNLNEDIMKQMKISEAGTEVILGKTCDKYLLNDPALKIKSAYSVWNGLPLKSEVSINGITAKVTAKKIEENCTISAEKFEISKDIKITEVK